MEPRKIAGQPEIILSLDDRDRLDAAVAAALKAGRLESAIFLANEIHRARPVPAAQLPEDCMRLTARGRYLDEQSGLTRDAILVLPGHERRSMGLVSVLDEIGTALLGLRAGQSMHWQSGRGGHRSIRLLEVMQ